LRDVKPAMGQRVQQWGLAIRSRMLAQAGRVPGDQPVAVQLHKAVENGAGRAAGERGPGDQGHGREADAVEQREDRVVLVVEPGQASRAFALVGWPDLVDPIEERKLAQGV
jgi:hypothetical protein